MALRDNTLAPKHIRNILNIINSGDLTIDNAAAFTASDYLHTGVIDFQYSFLESSNNYTKIIGVRVRESIPSGTLQKAALRIFFFDECDIDAVSNEPFDLGDGTNTTLNNLVGILDVPSINYLDLPSGASVLDAMATVNFTTPLIVEHVAGRVISAIAITTGTPDFEDDTILSIDLIIEMH